MWKLQHTNVLHLSPFLNSSWLSWFHKMKRCLQEETVHISPLLCLFPPSQRSPWLQISGLIFDRFSHMKCNFWLPTCCLIKKTNKLGKYLLKKPTLSSLSELWKSSLWPYPLVETSPGWVSSFNYFLSPIALFNIFFSFSILIPKHNNKTKQNWKKAFFWFENKTSRRKQKLS